MTTLGTAHAQHLLRISDLRAGELDELLDLAAAMKRRPGGWHKSLRSQSVACYFTKPIDAHARVGRVGDPPAGGAAHHAAPGRTPARPR